MTSVRGYEVDGFIGRGSAGAVFRAHDVTQPQRPLAIKRALVTADNPGDAECLRREWQLLSKLEHPNIVPVRELIQDDDGVAIVMEYAGRGSLADRLQRDGPMAAAAVVAMAIPLAEALAVAHRAGIVHGDIKPANILFSESGQPLLCDFGAARSRQHPGEHPAAVIGTDGYVDPHALAAGESSPQSDIYALGQVCHEALTARAGAPSVQDVPTPLRSLIARATAADPAARFGTAAEMAEALRSVREESTLERAVPALPPTRNFGSRPIAPAADEAGSDKSRLRALTKNRVASMAAGAAVILAIVGIGAWLGGGSATASRSGPRPAAAVAGSPPSPACAEANRPVAPTGATLLEGDLRGDGCLEYAISFRGDLIMPAGADHPEVRYHIGQPGDQLLVGDWNCDGRATAAVYRPATGDVVTFDGWARPGQPAPAASATRARIGGLAKVVHRPGSSTKQCDRVVVVGR